LGVNESGAEHERQQQKARPQVDSRRLTSEYLHVRFYSTTRSRGILVE